MKTELQRLEEQLERALEGEAWHGPSVLEVLDGVSAHQATAHPPLLDRAACSQAITAHARRTRSALDVSLLLGTAPPITCPTALHTPPAMPRLLVLIFAFAAAACAQPSATPPVAEVAIEDGPVLVVEVQGGLDHPWGATFLPDGRLLVTERAGRLRIVTGEGEPVTVAGTPTVFAQDQGGLLDVALDPDFETNQFLYLTYTKPGPDSSAATSVGRGQFEGDRLVDFEELWVQEPFTTDPRHFGARIAFVDGYLVVSTGERFLFDPAQNLGNTLGVLVRLTRNGEIPDDNPFVGQDGAKPEIWSYGHRNVQSLAVHPETGALWQAEYGPRGGDELNLIEPGLNYGWPIVSWGMNYDGTDIPDPPTHPEFADAVHQWTPTILPSGMAFYTGDAFPAWTGSLFLSSLQGLVRLELTGEEVTAEERIPLDVRIREVEPGPDGFLYVLTDQTDGAVWRLEPRSAE
ncbi:MAG TPA: PQQ-dependent sugar dehydrogenase [Rhodothermales bacterium]|nr:PQQ-dependent sugar dehydrogenase [Rhodothermales bacterium]